MLNSFRKLILEPKNYLENFTKIRTKEREIVQFRLNRLQQDLFENLKESRRTVILKARQVGITTGTIGFLYHDTITHPGVNSVIVAYSREAATSIFEIVKLLWNLTPKAIRPRIKYDTKYELSFPKLKSRISVLSASKAAGRGLTIHNLLCTELAYWSFEETFYGLMESVPENGRIIVESTPNGHDSLFYPLWINKDNGFQKLKYGWEWAYSPEFIEQKRKELGIHRFNQEYNLTFLHPEGAVFMENWNKFYQRYKWNYPVYIGVDPAASLKDKSDYSAICAVAFNPDRQRIWVLKISQGRMTNHALANKIISWYQKFEPILIGVETTAYQIALRQEIDRIAGELGISLPIKEVRPSTNKLQRFRALSTYFENGQIRIQHNMQELIEQLATYPKCTHEDLIDALEIAVSLTRSRERRPAISVVG